MNKYMNNDFSKVANEYLNICPIPTELYETLLHVHY